MAELTVAAGVARRMLEFAVQKGASEEELCALAGIEPDGLADHDNRVAFASYIALVRGAAALCDDPAFAMHFAEQVDMSEFSVVGLLTHASETMMEAFAQLNRYGQLVVEVDIGSEGRFALDASNGEMWLVDTRKDPNTFPELTESTFTRMVIGPRQFLPRPHVLEVHVTHPAPRYRDEYERIFQCPVLFESHRNAMRMEASLAMHRVQLQPRYVFGVLSAHAEQLLKELQTSKTTRGRVESLLMPTLHTGEVNMDKIAEKMGQSRQTLYRNLKGEGVTFEQVLDELRHKLALHYLSGQKVSVNETAYLVGFSDPASFSRAFKRWTGVNPRDARAPKPGV